MLLSVVVIVVHCVSEKRANFETVYLKIIRIDFDDIWQKYSKDSRIEFACFSFRVGLLLYQLFVFVSPGQFDKILSQMSGGRYGSGSGSGSCGSSNGIELYVVAGTRWCVDQRES